MIFAEIRSQIDQLSREERLKAMAYLKHLLRAESSDYQRELAQGHVEIENGKGVRWEDLKR